MHLQVNKAFERLTGYTQTQALGRRHSFLQGPDTDPVVLAEIEEALGEGRPVSAELLVYRAGGAPFWSQVRPEACMLCCGVGMVREPPPTHPPTLAQPHPPRRQVSITPIRDASGRVANWVAVQRDVSKRKAAEAAVQMREQALRWAGQVAGGQAWELLLAGRGSAAPSQLRSTVRVCVLTSHLQTPPPNSQVHLPAAT